MNRLDDVDEALSQLARRKDSLSDSFVEGLAMKMKHEARRSYGGSRNWSLIVMAAIGLSMLGAVGYAATSFFLWEVPMLGVSDDGELSEGYGGVVDSYYDEESGNYVTQMITDDGNPVTFRSKMRFEPKGFVFLKESNGEYELAKPNLPADGAVRLEPVAPAEMPLTVKAPGGKTIILSNDLPRKD